MKILIPGVKGIFLISESKTSPGQLILSLKNQEEFHHYPIKRTAKYVTFDPPVSPAALTFDTLVGLIDHYSKMADGLPLRLLYPAPKGINKVSSPKGN